MSEDDALERIKEKVAAQAIEAELEAERIIREAAEAEQQT